MAYRSEFLQTLAERGFIHQITDEDGLDAALMSGSKAKAYIGFDCTAPSLHVGNLVQIMMLRHLQRAGHRPIVLIGSGTTKVGDPSGRDDVRRILSEEEIAEHKASIQGIFGQFLDVGKGGAIFVDNAEWLDGLQYIPFLRDIGRHFTINRMLTFESVRLRLEREQPLTFLEFNYMILQAYDFLELHRRHGCLLQMGGSDQWGNIVNGIELTRRVEGASIYGLTTSLITTSDGAKMGKTAKGAVWLNESGLSHHDYWQFWRNTQDADVGRFLRLFTDLPMDEIARLEALEGAELNEAKKILADEATRICRGEKAQQEAAETARRTFEEGSVGAGQGLPTIDAKIIQAEVAAASEGPPGVILAGTKSPAESGVPVYEVIYELGLTSSKKEARRLIQQGGARVNDQVVESEDRKLSREDFDDDLVAKVSAGKKRHGIVRLKD